MTDVGDYLRLLYATSGEAHCLRCEKTVPDRQPQPALGAPSFALPEGTAVELCAPLARSPTARSGAISSPRFAPRAAGECGLTASFGILADELALDEDTQLEIEAVVDRVLVKRSQAKQLLVALTDAAKAGGGLCALPLRRRENRGAILCELWLPRAPPDHLWSARAGSSHLTRPKVHASPAPGWERIFGCTRGFSSPIRRARFLGGAFVKEAFNVDKHNNNGRMHLGTRGALWVLPRNTVCGAS